MIARAAWNKLPAVSQIPQIIKCKKLLSVFKLISGKMVKERAWLGKTEGSACDSKCLDCKPQIPKRRAQQSK